MHFLKERVHVEVVVAQDRAQSVRRAAEALAHVVQLSAVEQLEEEARLVHVRGRLKARARNETR